MSKRISIILLTFNSERYVQKCLKSIEKEMGKNDELIVVDNSSQDNTLKRVLELEIIGLRVIRSKQNIGFSKGINLGARQGRGNYLLFVNPDTFIRQGAIELLINCLTNNNADIAGGKMFRTDKKLSKPCCLIIQISEK